MRRFLDDRRSQAIAVGVTLLYVLVFQYATSELTIGGGSRPFSFFALANWPEVVFRQRVAFQFESVAVLEGPFFTWLLSPVNIAFGVILGALTGAQIALTSVARKCSVSCGLSPAAGLFAGLPGLLAGSACCAPIIFVLLGLQLTASLVTLMGLMVPIAFVLLLGGLAYTIRIAARRCGEAAEFAV
ncbi:MAG: hypothetical protein ACTSU0_07290 [Alphaproteobacteria bacterium]